jgi:hypothetical protein
MKIINNGDFFGILFRYKRYRLQLFFGKTKWLPKFWYNFKKIAEK